jgi:cation transport ATPase
MYRITDEEIDFILEDITRKGILTEDVRYNVLDHVCCIIENEIKDGMSFKEFYEDTISKFYRNELCEIEEETQKLLTFKHYYAMKRTLKISGVTAIILIILGVTFKTMHWPGAGIIIVLGLAFFSLIFIPLNIVLKFQDDKESSNRIIMTIGMLTASAASIGVLFKIMHWPYANILMFSSLLVFTLVFIPIYFVTKYKDPDSKFNAIINTAFMVAGAGMLFALINFGYSKKHVHKENIEIHQIDTTIKHE